MTDRKFSDDDFGLLAAAIWSEIHADCRDTCRKTGVLCADDHVRLALIDGLTHGKIKTWPELWPWIVKYQTVDAATRSRLTEALR